MINIYNYVNYRLYLKDFLAEARKKSKANFSHSVLLGRLGISSTGFISNVIAGRKNLSPIQSSRLATALKLNKAHQVYFESMVCFTQAATIDEKNEYFNRMVTLQKVNMKVIDKKKMSLFSKWYYVVVRELLFFLNFRHGDNPKKLASVIDPPVKPSEVIDAIDALERLGLVKKDENGRYRQVDNAVTTGDEVRSLTLANFQLNTMDLAKRALKKVPATDRDISVMTMTISPDTFRLVKSELQHMRKRIAALVVDEKDPDRVFQLNMQLFPVTRKVKGTGNE